MIEVIIVNKRAIKGLAIEGISCRPRQKNIKKQNMVIPIIKIGVNLGIKLIFQYSDPKKTNNHTKTDTQIDNAM